MRRACVGLVLLVGCTKTVVPSSPTEEAPRRPDWVVNLAAQVDAMSACLESREEPNGVAYLTPLASGAVGVNTIDAYGAIDYCVYLDGRVVRREAASFSGVDVATSGGAVFQPGPRRPHHISRETPMEEILEGGQVLGWLYWPPAPTAIELEESEAVSAGGES